MRVLPSGSTTPMTRAGVPATTLAAGTSEVTTAPAATMEPLPIVTPIMTTELAPMNTKSPMTTGARSTVS